ncbi:MAG TPA: hypothetical protein VMV51_14560 [Gemmatimonadaceae bacterium]|nr:hypothetical protein [Gemmatimonadaceae bacterium]
MTRTQRAAASGAACLISMATLALASAAQAQTVDYRVSAGYATGSYIFSGTAWSAAMFHSLDVQGGRFKFTASVPIIAQNNTALTYIGGIIVPTGGPDDAAVAGRRNGDPIQMGPGMGTGRDTTGGNGRGGSGGRMGGNVAPTAAVMAVTTADTLTVTEPGGTTVHVGDPMFSGSVDLYTGTGILRAMTVHAFAKAPMASVASGVSTGQWDFGGGASLALGSGQRFFFGDASYWVLGDMPELELLDNVVYGVGFGQSTVDGKWSLLGSVSGSTAVIRNVTPPASAGFSIGYRPSSFQSLTWGLSFGLTESASTVSTSLGWRVRLF